MLEADKHSDAYIDAEKSIVLVTTLNCVDSGINV